MSSGIAYWIRPEGLEVALVLSACRSTEENTTKSQPPAKSEHPQRSERAFDRVTTLDPDEILDRAITLTCEALDGLAQPFQVAVIAGGDQSLYEKAARRHWNFPILVENYVTNMAEWMLCADLLVTKAGGLILSEGLAAGLPILMIDYLPGQEEGNVRFILEHQAGAMVKTPGEFRWRVEAWLRDNQAGLKAIASTARRLGRPDAALVVADALWQAGEHGAPLETPRLRVWNTM